MPFESDRQRRFMYAKHPGIARRWTREAKRKKEPVTKSDTTPLVEIAKALPGRPGTRIANKLFGESLVAESRAQRAWAKDTKKWKKAQKLRAKTEKGGSALINESRMQRAGSMEDEVLRRGRG